MIESNIFLFLFTGVSIVKPQIAVASEFCGQPEIEAYRFRMPYMQITIRLGGKRVMTLPPFLPVFTSSETMERMKLGGGVRPTSPDSGCFHDFYLALMMNYSIAVHASNLPRVCTHHRAYFTI